MGSGYLAGMGGFMSARTTAASALCVLALLLAGCVSVPAYKEGSWEIVTTAGESPTSEQAAAAVEAFLQRTLKDPDSLKQFRWLSGPTLATWSRGQAGSFDQGWVMCFEYNAKNSYGGYVGVTTDAGALRGYSGVFSVVPNFSLLRSSVRC
jgi:hypothetical protein